MQPAHKTTDLDFHCPTCAQPLENASLVLVCRDCGIAYPSLGDVTVCYPNPTLDLAAWRASAHLELQKLIDAQSKAHAARHTCTSQLTHSRLGTLSLAYTAQLECLTRLLEPLIADTPSSDEATYGALRTQPLAIPTTLFGYAANLFRDWVWGEEENTQALNILQATQFSRRTANPAGSWGKVLVLGAGAGRLAWEISGLTDADVVAVDANPFTSLVGARLTAGESVDLWEFPLAPKEIADVAIPHTLSADCARDNLHWILADARQLPFAPGSFDTVITPWYTDVVQDQPAATAQRINNLLVDGGQWLNYGSVAFADADISQCLTLEELLELVGQQGYKTPLCIEASGPYLKSPYSCFSRVEELHAFAATKNAQSEVPGKPALPDWLTDMSVPVPALESFRHQAVSTQVHAFLMAQIDDQKSIEDIAGVLQERQLMDAAEAVPVVRDFLNKLYTDTQR